MSKVELGIVVGLVFLVGSNLVRFIVLARWIDRLNEGLPTDQQFQLLGWWTPEENRRAWKRWKAVRASRMGS